MKAHLARLEDHVPFLIAMFGIATLLAAAIAVRM